MQNNFTQSVIDFCEEQNYKRDGSITEEEFSQVAFRLYGCFTTADLSLENMVEIANCALLARLNKNYNAELSCAEQREAST
ncbi:hypothetical protein [Methylomonas sp. CM2]|uniref:hypothetical protein n=1 Tax=Methylomonas sp. CM2 TaxID=3417647 RepID=UPI003CEFC847